MSLDMTKCFSVGKRFLVRTLIERHTNAACECVLRTAWSLHEAHLQSCPAHNRSPQPFVLVAGQYEYSRLEQLVRP